MSTNAESSETSRNMGTKVKISTQSEAKCRTFLTDNSIFPDVAQDIRLPTGTKYIQMFIVSF